MPRNSSKHPTELEFQILKILWERGPLAVRDVRSALMEDEQRELAHTSVITTLNTMVGKKYLQRKPKGNAYIFAAAVQRGDVSQGILNDVVSRIFDGSAVSMMLNLLEHETVSLRERGELKKLIDEYRSTKGMKK